MANGLAAQTADLLRLFAGRHFWNDRHFFNNA